MYEEKKSFWAHALTNPAVLMSILALVTSLVFGYITIERNSAFNGLTGPRSYGVHEICTRAKNAQGKEVVIDVRGYWITYKEPLRTRRYLSFSPSDLNAYFELGKDTRIEFYSYSQWNMQYAKVFSVEEKPVVDSLLVLLEKEPDQFIEQ